MHFLFLSFPSLHISDCGASRSLSKEYLEFGSSCSAPSFEPWTRNARRRNTHRDERFQLLLGLLLARRHRARLLVL